MLKKWVEEIRNQQDLYKSEYWKYHLSGNVVEFSILPVYLKKKNQYRCSVIAVGQVLQALSKKIEEHHLNFHIQSFPSLENPEIVATIRTGQKGNFTHHTKLHKKSFGDQKDIRSTLNNLVGQYPFFLRKAENFSETELNAVEPPKNYGNLFVISSVHNNPFTWLNVGYLKESLRHQYSHLPANYLSIFDKCSESKIQHEDFQIAENEYVQFFVHIEPINISTE